MTDITQGTSPTTAGREKPSLGLFQIISMSFGFFGIQIGFALQNGNVSRIFQTLGAETDQLALYWLAGPITGLLVQPIIGYLSDKTWTSLGSRWIYSTLGIVMCLVGLGLLGYSQFWNAPVPVIDPDDMGGGFPPRFLWGAMMVGGIAAIVLLCALVAGFIISGWAPGARRRPYFMTGAVLACVSLTVMANVPGLWAAILMLWVLDASLNISMEPFRAFVGDRLNSTQRPTGFAMQTVFIGAGAVVGSLLPIIWTEIFGVSNAVPEGGGIPQNVRLSLYVGAGALLLALLYTIRTSGEYSPEDISEFVDDEAIDEPELATAKKQRPDAGFFTLWGAIIALIGLVLTALVYFTAGDKQFYVMTGGLIFLGILFLINSMLVKANRDARNFLSDVLGDLVTMPSVMKRLAVVQFFSWFGLFIMWIYTTDSVALQVWQTDDASTVAYQTAGDWVGVMFAVQNGVAALYAFVIAALARIVGSRALHAFNLMAGAAGFIGYHLFTTQTGMLIPMVALGMAWGSILSLPYAILSNALPPRKMGIYMGIFNFFIVLPQILVGGTMGPILRTFKETLALAVGGQPLLAVLFGAGAFTLAAIAMLFVKKPEPS